MSTRGAPDQGAFSFVPGVDQAKVRSTLRGFEFKTTKTLMRVRREPSDWTPGFIVNIHREVFGTFFQADAGRPRQGEANFGRRAGAKPQQIDALIQQLAAKIQGHLAAVRAETGEEQRLQSAFLFAAEAHADMIGIHPFVDGNGRWARIGTTLFLSDCGYPVGSIVSSATKEQYIAAIDRCLDQGAPGDLAEHLLRGYISAMQSRGHGL